MTGHEHHFVQLVRTKAGRYLRCIRGAHNPQTQCTATRSPDPIPGPVRRGVLDRSERHCEDCGAPHTPLAPLEMHHLRYWVPVHAGRPDWGEEPIFGRETPDDLAALCRDCHHSRHIDRNGEYWADPQEMEEHWFGFDWAT